MVLGGTGMVGGELIGLLLRDPGFARVVAPARRLVTAPAGFSAEQRDRLDARVVDFDRLDGQADAFNGVTHIFCALGTTIRLAGSQEKFRRVDHDYPVAAARLGLQLGAVHYLLVSALGADAGSRVFYNRVKGETERDVCAVGYPAVTIVRPSLLLGEREDFRLGEQVAKWFAWLTPARLAPVHARDVGAALVASANEKKSGTLVIESAAIPRRNLR
ncbi:MAG: NAD(P)H-binding protein [Gemmatimonadaceae bacterium]|nr:NAD(P)H-binding protein [Gemmatimonadaceae bacterium]